MKALTIWQPWASLIACGVKQYETRSWPTKYRGPIAIHAAARYTRKWDLPVDLAKVVDMEMAAGRCPKWEAMPFGAVIATAELVDVWHIAYNVGEDAEEARRHPIIAESMEGSKIDVPFGRQFVPTGKEIILGDWAPGRYAWELANVKMLQSPIPVKGKQGLWNFEMPGDGGVVQ